MKRYITFFALLAVLAVASCERPEPTVRPEENKPQLGESLLRFRHHAETVKLPTLWPVAAGAYGGMVSWGDIADDEAYQPGLQHQYSSVAQFGVQISGQAASKVRFEDLADIDLIDLSRF